MDDMDEAPDYGDSDDADDELEFDCGMDRHGFCGKAGSEECDFECPFRDRTVIGEGR